MSKLLTKKNRFNIGIVGFLENSEKVDAAHVKITSLLAAITERVLSKENEYYQTSQQDVSFDLYTSPLLAGDFWVEYCQHWNMGELCAVMPENNEDTSSFQVPGLHRTTISSALKGVAQVCSMADWISCQIDIAFALWDGNEASHDGSIWMFIERCKQNGVPCIWINTTDYEKSYWFKNIYPELFNREVLWQHIDGFYTEDTMSGSIGQIQPQGYLFSKLWGRLSSKYEKRRGIVPVFDNTKKLPEDNTD